MDFDWWWSLTYMFRHKQRISTKNLFTPSKSVKTWFLDIIWSQDLNKTEKCYYIIKKLLSVYIHINYVIGDLPCKQALSFLVGYSNWQIEGFKYGSSKDVFWVIHTVYRKSPEKQAKASQLHSYSIVCIGIIMLSCYSWKFPGGVLEMSLGWGHVLKSQGKILMASRILCFVSFTCPQMSLQSVMRPLFHLEQKIVNQLLFHLEPSNCESIESSKFTFGNLVPFLCGKNRFQILFLELQHH